MDDKKTAPPAVHKKSRLFRQYIVKNELQYKFLLYILGISGLTLFSVWLPGKLAILNMFHSGDIPDGYVMSRLTSLNNLTVLWSCVAIFFIFLISIVTSNFVAGPIYRIEQTLKRIKEGDISMNVHIRKYDELHETVDLLNVTLASLREKLGSERQATNALREKITSFIQDPSQKNELLKILDGIKQNPNHIKIEKV